MKTKFDIGQTVYFLEVNYHGEILIKNFMVVGVEIKKEHERYELGINFTDEDTFYMKEKAIFASKEELINHYINLFEKEKGAPNV